MKNFWSSKPGRQVRAFIHLQEFEEETRREVINQLSLYGASSAGSSKAKAALTLEGAREIIRALEGLGDGDAIDKEFQQEIIQAISDSSPASEILRSSFTAYGSDKATDHDYDRLYGFLLRDFDSVSRILEIGLGTTDTRIVSNMGISGSPGASLRAFRDCCVSAEVIGLEFDSKILFTENRIRTYFVDQTRPETFADLSDVVGGDFDLMVDDGLHAPHANIFSLSFFMPRLKIGGFAVIEDISKQSVLIWKVVSRQLPESFRSALVRTKAAWVFVVQRVT